MAAAAVESVAENASDSLVAPLFFFAVGGVPAALAYRACNTLDAMIGYHGDTEWLGKAAARLDDAANLVPARLTAALLVVASAFAGARRSARCASGGATARAPRARTRGGRWRRWPARSACSSRRSAATRSASGAVADAATIDRAVRVLYVACALMAAATAWVTWWVRAHA